MNGYEQVKSGEATYFGEALIAAQALGGEVFAQYAASQGAAVWEGLLPHAEARHAGVIARAAEVCAVA